MDPDDLCAHSLWKYVGGEGCKWGHTVAAYAAAAALALVALVPGPVTQHVMFAERGDSGGQAPAGSCSSSQGVKRLLTKLTVTFKLNC
jgi:hypothetical protein